MSIGVGRLSSGAEHFKEVGNST